MNLTIRGAMLVVLMIWSVGYVLAMAIVAWRTGDVPAALLGAGPAGVIGILVAFTNTTTPTPPTPSSAPDPKPHPEEK